MTSRRARPGGARWGLAAAALLTLATAALLQRSNAPPLPAAVPESVVRGAVVDPVTPLGTVDAVPRELRWKAIDGAGVYEARLRRIDGSELWRGSVASPRAELPAAVRADLHPAVRYLWTVEAYDGERRLAASGAIEFHIALGAVEAPTAKATMQPEREP